MHRIIAASLAVLCVVGLPAAASAQEELAEPLPAPGTALEPGRYVSSAVGPSIEFRVADGWLVGGGVEGGPIFTLERTDPPGQVVTVTRFDGEAFTDSCDPTSLTEVETSANRLIAIVAGNPFLSAAPPAPIEVGGFEGQRLDVATPFTPACDRQLLLLWALPMENGEFIQVPGQQSRFVAIDVEGEAIVVAIESFPGVPFGGLLEASMQLVESMRIVPRPETAPQESTPPVPSAEPSPAPSASPDIDEEAATA